MDNGASFEQLLRPHMERLYRLAFRLAGQRSEAEDLFQDVLTKAYVRLEDLADIEEPGPWLCRVMYNHFIDNRRKYTRQRLVVVNAEPDVIEGVPGSNDDEPDHEVQRRDNIKRLEDAMASLNDDYREALVLHDVEGYKLQEIHELTGAPVGTIKARLHRARARLREILGDLATF